MLMNEVDTIKEDKYESSRNVIETTISEIAHFIENIPQMRL